ncbi:uncharacterized protein PV07_02510 [Cladophialophora immunda]|uniref:Uncharacterized protein n=1 Tax=Cladophialophora immunda TaxID=569365 RepID=A0A0D2CL44_9EURO|nr:uncharacterized protein PV07_02510 [Cladophialophora immunda]KIW30810.1 hypothetical protein PV07_02510 [Cladophialophora immunda]
MWSKRRSRHSGSANSMLLVIQYHWRILLFARLRHYVDMPTPRHLAVDMTRSGQPTDSLQSSTHGQPTSSGRVVHRVFTHHFETETDTLTTILGSKQMPLLGHRRSGLTWSSLCQTGYLRRLSTASAPYRIPILWGTGHQTPEITS